VLGTKVAVKILNKGKIQALEMAEKVKREINILNLCKHPHIIRLYEVRFEYPCLIDGWHGRSLLWLMFRLGTLVATTRFWTPRLIFL
jgi:serine/threonine protein kinase